MGAPRLRPYAEDVGRRIGLRQRKKVIERDGPTCYLCLRLVLIYGEDRGRQRPSTRTLDHITPLRWGGTDIIENLSVCCALCNVSKDDLFPAGRRSEAMLQLMCDRLRLGVPYRPPGFVVPSR